MDINHSSTETVAEAIDHIAPAKQKSDVLLKDKSSSVSLKNPEIKQSSTEMQAEAIDHITPKEENSDVLLRQKTSEKAQEANAQTEAKPQKCGILRRISKTPDMQRSRTEISISKFAQKIPELVRTEQSKNILKPSKIKAPCIFHSVKKEPSPPEKSCNQPKLISRKKSRSSVELQFQTNITKAIQTNETSKTSRLSTPSSFAKQWSMSSAGMQVAALPVKAIHKPGTIPSYLEHNKNNTLQSQLNKRQKEYDDSKKDCMKKYDNLVKCNEKLKSSGAKEIVLENLEWLPIIGSKTGNGDAVEQTSSIDPVLQSDALELANYNILRYVEAEMKKISDSYLQLCQDFLETNLKKDVDSESPEDCFFNNSMVKLTENIAKMKLQQETALSNCQTELKSMFSTNVKSGTSKSVQDLIMKTEQQNERQMQKLKEEIEVMKTKVLAVDQQNKILEKTKTDNENNREKALKTTIMKKDNDIRKYSDKCNRLEILNKKNDRKIAEMEAKLKEPITEAERLLRDLEATNRQLSDKTQQYNQLKAQVAEMFRQHEHSIAENGDKLSKELDEKYKIQTDLFHAREVIEQFRNQPVELSSTGCGDDSENLARSIEIESHQCTINEMKIEIQRLVQERQRLLDIPDITQESQKLKSLQSKLEKYERTLQHKNSVIYKLEHQLNEDTKRLYDSGASMQAEIVNLKRLDDEKQSELDSLRVQLSHANADLRQKNETIGRNKRLIRIRNELTELRMKECPDHDKLNNDIFERSEEFSNLFSTLTEKQITITQQQLIIKRLDEHHARNVIAWAKQIERFKELQAENTRLRIEISVCSKPSTSSVEILQNSIDLTTALDRREMYLNDRKIKRRANANNKK